MNRYKLVFGSEDYDADVTSQDNSTEDTVFFFAHNNKEARKLRNAISNYADYADLFLVKGKHLIEVK